MPRTLDVGNRKNVIAEAVLALAARHSLDGVSVRDVAAEAQVSVGMVQHYFRTKDDMLLFACRFLIDRANAGITTHLASHASRSPRATLRTIFEQMLPLDEERRVELRIWIAFVARAFVEPELGTFMRQRHINTHQIIAQQLREAQQSGEIAQTTDIEQATIGLFMLVEGLVSHVQLGHYSGEQALRAVDERLDTIFTP